MRKRRAPAASGATPRRTGALRRAERLAQPVPTVSPDRQAERRTTERPAKETEETAAEAAVRRMVAAAYT